MVCINNNSYNMRVFNNIIIIITLFIKHVNITDLIIYSSLKPYVYLAKVILKKR